MGSSSSGRRRAERRAVGAVVRADLAGWALAGVAVLALGLGCQSRPPAREAPWSDADPAARAPGARHFRGDWPVRPLPDGSIVAEAEEFSPGPDSRWRARKWGENYYAATIANTFLSRKAFLGAPAQCEPSEAVISVQVPRPGRYLVLVRYEAAYRFETRFTLRVEQHGRVRLQRLYGARKNLKVWPFRRGVIAEAGLVENLVWEGHDTAVELEAGIARITLVAGRQPEPAARRHVDLVMLTADHQQVAMRIAKEGHLPLDGLLTQAGDVYLRVHNEGPSPVVTTVRPGSEHSPYWVHLRTWKPLTLRTAPGGVSDWAEVGSLLDSLNDGRWHITVAAADGGPAPRSRLEFGLRSAAGAVEPIERFAPPGADLWLAYDADTRYTRRLRPIEAVLHDALDDLRGQRLSGSAPRRIPVRAVTFDARPGDDRYRAAVEEFARRMGITVDNAVPGQLASRSGVVDARDVHGARLQAMLDRVRAEGTAGAIRIVSLGDEIDLAQPPAGDHEGFRAWARAEGLAPSAIVPGADDWADVQYTPDRAAAARNRRAYYFSRRYAQDFGLADLRVRTDAIRRALPHAEVGANYSPHPSYLGEAHKYITVFRRGAMTMPWGEDYAWQIPIGTQQISFLQLDLFRAGVRYRPGQAIHFYVMPHWPGNTVRSWRRMWYGALAHGMTAPNLFELRPVQVAYTENHVSLPAMYREVRRAVHELSAFEDIVQDGAVRRGDVALWYSATGDIWDDHAPPLGAGKRLLYAAVRHHQLALDVVDEEDALRGTLAAYRVLYLTDAHVSAAAAGAIAAWVRGGGHLFATANAGMFDEFDDLHAGLRALLGVQPHALDTPADSSVVLDKGHLPFARVLDTATWHGPAGPVAIPVVGARSRFIAAGAEVVGTFTDGSPAVTTRRVGRGTATYVGFLPALAYFRPAIPRRPMDRGTTDGAMAHFVPTRFDPGARALIGWPAAGVPRPVLCSNPLVESTVIESGHGLAVPLINWSAGPLRGLRVTLAADDVRGRRVSLASGGAVAVLADGSAPAGRAVLVLDLDVADAVILR